MTKKPRPLVVARRDLPLDANALELFARIAAAGSFAQAARNLGLTRAAISRRVQAMEEQLGAPLFVRTTRALGLTETGRRLATRARAVLDATESARRSLRSRGAAAGGGLAGTLRVTAVPSFGQTVLGPLLASFQAANPELRLELRFTHRRVDLVREDIDVAFRLTSRPPEDCVATPLLPFVVHAYAAPGPGLPLPGPVGPSPTSPNPTTRLPTASRPRNSQRTPNGKRPATTTTRSTIRSSLPATTPASSAAPPPCRDLISRTVRSRPSPIDS